MTVEEREANRRSAENMIIQLTAIQQMMARVPRAGRPKVTHVLKEMLKRVWQKGGAK